MNVPTRIVLTCLAVVGGVFFVRHGATALTPALPENMPADATFIRSGYDLSHNEATGEWIACRTEFDRDTDLCRVTDAHGAVIYQGDFLPLNSLQPLPADQLKVSTTRKADMWVDGPAEEAPVPVIPLANGTMLVPSDDTYALATRWSRNPGELQRISSE